MNDNFEMYDDEIEINPCCFCEDREYCDGWEAQFCCRLCMFYNEYPDCENCDSWDI